MAFDFTDAVSGTETRDMGLRAGTWQDLAVGVFTAEFGALPQRPLDDMTRYLCQLSALQACLATDVGRELVGGVTIGEVYPSTDDLPPSGLTVQHGVELDGADLDAWSAVLRGCRVAVGDPRTHPLVLLAAPGPDEGWPPLRTA